MDASIGNQYKVLNQVLKLIIKLPGQYQLKKIITHVFFITHKNGGNMFHQTI